MIPFGCCGSFQLKLMNLSFRAFPITVSGAPGTIINSKNYIKHTKNLMTI